MNVIIKISCLSILIAVVLPQHHDCFARLPIAGPCFQNKIKTRTPIGKTTPQTTLPDCSHYDQGSTPTCSYHASSILLGSLAQTPLSALDAIVKTHGSLSEGSDFLPILSFFKKNPTINRETQTCVEDVDDLNDLVLKDSQALCTPQAKSILDSLGVIQGTKEIVDALVDRKSSDDFPLRTFCENPSKRLTLPAYNIRHYNFFKDDKDIKTFFLEHFKKSESPLGFTICFSSDCLSSHAVAATGVHDVTCSDGTHAQGVEIFNSWGDGSQFVSFDRIAEMIPKIGSDINEVVPCGDEPQMESHCTDLIENETDPHLDPLLAYAQTGNSQALSRVLKLPENQAFVNLPQADGKTPLAIAAKQGHLEAVKILIKNGATVDSKTLAGVTPLFLAAQEGHAQIVSILADAKADLDLKLKSGSTPLCMAASEGHAEVVETLLKKGAAVNLAGSFGASALFMSAQQNHIDVLKVLLKNDARVDQSRTDDGATPLFIALLFEHNTIVDLLVKTGKIDFNQEMQVAKKFKFQKIEDQIKHLQNKFQTQKHK